MTCSPPTQRSTSESDTNGRRQSWSGNGISRRVKLPGFLRQPRPSGKESPVCINDDPKLHKRKQKGLECIADALSANQVDKEGGKNLVPRNYWRGIYLQYADSDNVTSNGGVGRYGASFAEYIRGIAADHIEDLRRPNAKCKITNRISDGVLKLEIGSEIIGQEGGGTFCYAISCPFLTSSWKIAHRRTLRLRPNHAIPKASRCFANVSRIRPMCGVRPSGRNIARVGLAYIPCWIGAMRYRSYSL